MSLPHFYVTVGVICLFLLLLLRLWFLQIIKGDEYRTMSESNRTRVQDILPPQGHDRGPQRHHPGGQLSGL